MEDGTISETNSYEEAYDPWPGCTMSETGCHSGCYYKPYYKVSPSLIHFFKLDSKSRYSMSEIEKLIFKYAEEHNGFITKTNFGHTHRIGLKYDVILWNLLEVSHDKQIKIYHIEKILDKLCKYDPKPKIQGTYLEDL